MNWPPWKRHDVPQVDSPQIKEAQMARRHSEKELQRIRNQRHRIADIGEAIGTVLHQLQQDDKLSKAIEDSMTRREDD
jgi:hypothetical protein